MKTIIVGDLHAMPSNIEDTEKILDLCIKTAKTCSADLSATIFLGDIFHTHAVVRQEAAHIVKNKIIELARESNRPVFLLAGNHDGSSPHSVSSNAVRLVFGDRELDGIFVVDDEDGLIFRNFFMVPFIGDNQRFIDTCQKYRDKILVCHQTVSGAYYENKMLAPGGVDQSLLPQPTVIAGHIHMEQSVGKVFYPGTPRALNANEYNESKGIWLFDDNGVWTKIPTDSLVKRFIRYNVHEDSELEAYVFDCKDWKINDDVRIYVSGSEDFYIRFIEQFEQENADHKQRVRFIPNIKKNLKKSLDVDSEGENLHKALNRYVFDIYDASGEMKEKVWKKLQDLIPNLGDRI